MESQRMSSNHQYKVALALNDRGIRLLEAHCYPEGIDAFNNAFFLMKSLTIAIERNDYTLLTEMTKLKQLLDESTKKIPKTSSNMNSYGAWSTNILQFVHITEERGPMNTTITEAVCTISYPMNVFCIHLDEMNGESEMQNANLDLEAGIILFNLSNICRAYSVILTFNNDDQESQKYLQRSLALYRLALSVLTRVYTTDRIVATRHSLLLLMILQGLIQVSFEMGFADDANRYTRQIEKLKTKISTKDLEAYVNNQRSIPSDVASAA